MKKENAKAIMLMFRNLVTKKVFDYLKNSSFVILIAMKKE
jgi:hypothetical protein